VGAYATVMLHRPIDTKQKRMPARALGLVWIKRAAEERKLTVEIGGAEKVRSGSEVRLPLTVQGLADGASAHVTVAAVDVGILNLTGFQEPDPASVLHAQTKLGAEIRDLYGRLIDGMSANAGTLKSGGDADGGMQMSGPPPLERTVALFSGIIKVGPGGKAETTFQLPQFNGAVRLMAVVWNKQQIGHGTRDLIVRDPVALTLGAPRFLTIGDKTQLSIDLHNVEANAQDFAVTLRSARDGAPVRDLATRTVGLKRGERRTVTVPFAPQDIGLHTVTVTITGTLDEAPMTVARDLTLDVKPAAADVRRTVTQTLKSGETLTLPEQLTSGLIATGSRIGISAGPSARFDVPGLLASLDRYPYGCTEQTISRALPLLYANGLSKSSGGAHDPALAKRIGDAVTRVLARQSSSGAFGLWSPFSDDIWLTAYAADFLSRARDAGQPVPERAFSQALDRLANFVNYTQEVRGDGADLAYALYALARNGRASSGTLRYYAETKLAAFKSPASKARVAAALAMIGDTATAERVFATAAGAFKARPQPTARQDFGSPISDAATVVALAGDADVLGSVAPARAWLEQAMGARSVLSTQEQVAAVLAARAIEESGGNLRFTIAGKAHSGPIAVSMPGADQSTAPLTIRNDGDATEVLLTAVGAGLKPQPATSKGFGIERAFYALDGKPVSLESGAGGTSSVRQNTRMVVVLSVRPDERTGRLILVDRLPAGFEIENPRLVEGGQIKALPWLKTAIKPEHTEFRDDRLVAAFDLFRVSKTGDTLAPLQVAYVVRAVRPGTYVHPAATIEDMYRPERHARTAAGRLTVTAAE
ncbi:MAG: alpha-2-macroglobulin family protein, partial [Pseudomonadota bacterium]